MVTQARNLKTITEIQENLLSLHDQTCALENPSSSSHVQYYVVWCLVQKDLLNEATLQGSKRVEYACKVLNLNFKNLLLFC